MVLVYGDGDIARATAVAFEAEGHCVVTSAEVPDVAAVDSLVSGIVDQWGGIDVVIMATAAPSGDETEAIVRAGLLVPLMVATRANVEMQRTGSGVIVNVIESGATPGRWPRARPGPGCCP